MKTRIGLPKLFLTCISVIALHATAHATVTIVPMGDSITAGWDGAAMPGYRQYLLNDLASQGIAVQYQGVYDPTSYGSCGTSSSMTALGQNKIAANGGYTSADILQNLNGNENPPYPNTGSWSPSNFGGYWMTGGNGTGRNSLSPQIVLLMIGTNDGTSAYEAALTPSQTDANITGILNWFASNRPSTTVIIASPPPSENSSYESIVGTENSWLSANITKANFPDARYVDVYDSFFSDGSINSSFFSGDGVHPSDAGYAVIAGDYDAAFVPNIPEPTGLEIMVMVVPFLLRRPSSHHHFMHIF